MKRSLIGSSMLVALVALFVAVQIAAGAGEPKNQAPFTRVVRIDGEIRGEAKNQSPFTRLVVARALQRATVQRAELEIRGEAKNELPFTRLVRR